MALGSKRVLVVDNHPVILKFMQHVLESGGHQVVTAHDGLSALEALADFTPDVCFIDLIMENIGGGKLCKVIRDQPKHRDAFLVILSAIAAEEENPFDKYNADAFIAKGPFDQMSAHILAIMEKMDSPEREALRRTVIGKDKLHAREITRELLASKEHYETALNNIAEGYLELLGGRIIYANIASQSIVGRPEERLLNVRFAELFDAEDEQTVAELLESAEGSSMVVRRDQPFKVNGKLVSLKIIPVNDEGFSSTLVVCGDVTRQVELESQLRNAQKMKAIGALAGGVAHDLNNVLTGLVSYPDLLLLQLPDDSPLRKSIETIKKSGEKAAAIVEDLLTLARRNVASREAVNLNEVVREYLSSPEYWNLRAFHSGVDIVVDLDEDLLCCEGSEIHLAKMIMNLTSNAAEAIPDEGTVTITTENRHVDASLTERKDMPEGDYVCLRVCDDGTGISMQDRERLFEPFFTKKKMGRSGSGLGMAVVWGTVKDHDGYIDVTSAIGDGTTVTVHLPSTRDGVEPVEKRVSMEKYRGNHEKILVVDDVTDQHEIAANILETLGYEASCVASGEEAIDYLKTNSVDLVILDMIMDPGIDGLDTYMKIIENNPDQRVILVSGFSETDRTREALELGALAYIRKPYTVESIGRAVKTALEED